MEVKNNSVALLTRQVAHTSSKEETTTNEASGFKNLLKNKHHETKAGHKETSHSHKEESTESEHAAQLHTKVSTQAHSADEMTNNLHEVVGKISAGDKKVDDDTEEGKEIIIPSELLTAQMSSNQIMEVMTTPLEESPYVPQKLEMIDTATGQKVLKTPVEMMVANQELGKQSKTSDTMQEQKSILDSDALKSSTPNKVQEEPEILPTQTVKTGKKQNTLEKEKKGSEESLGVNQEKSHEPKLTQSIQPNDAVASKVTVKADNAEELEAKLAEQMIKQIQTGKKELEVQLDPKNLGKINIKVSYEDNQVSVSVTCSESKTMKMLSNSAVDLGHILESNIERPVQIIVDKQETNYLNNQQEQGNGGQQQRQHQESRQEETQEDFLQKLRLGILETDSMDNSYA